MVERERLPSGCANNRGGADGRPRASQVRHYAAVTDMAAILTVYPFGGCNSPANHLATSGDVIGSASSQCKHVGRSGPLPSGRATSTSGLPQRAQFKVLDIP